MSGPCPGVWRCRALLVWVLCAPLVLAGCPRSTPAEKPGAASTETPAAAKSDAKAPGAAGTEPKAPPAEGKEGGEKANEPPTVKLKPEQVEAIGVTTRPVAAVEHRDETAGYGVVLTHDTIAQPLAELRSAEAAARQSQSALARARSLNGTPGAVSADVEETAARQAGVDSANLALARQKLASAIGTNPPWPAAQNSTVLEKIAASRVRLVRATYPLGVLSGALPKSLRATPLGAPGAAAGWTLQPVWPAPADATVPGRSVFALLEQNEAAEGERLVVYAPTGEAHPGVEVPAAALVMSEGKYWIYLEREPGTFERVEIRADAPTARGYFITSGVQAGDRVVDSGAGALLAQESNSGGEPD